jgi:predicted nucleic acid-binding protein
VELASVTIDVVEVEDGRAYWEAMSDLAAPVMTLVNQLDPNTRERYINDVITAADAMKQGDTLRMRGTTWVAAAQR